MELLVGLLLLFIGGAILLRLTWWLARAVLKGLFWLAIIAGVILLAAHRELWPAAMTLGIIALGFWVMIRPVVRAFFPKRKP